MNTTRSIFEAVSQANAPTVENVANAVEAAWFDLVESDAEHDAVEGVGLFFTELGTEIAKRMVSNADAMVDGAAE